MCSPLPSTLNSINKCLCHILFRYIAEQALEDGVNSEIYICGMQPVEEDMPCTDIFQCDLGLTCALPIEMDFYNIYFETF